jgi:hypothetical protein
MSEETFVLDFRELGLSDADLQKKFDAVTRPLSEVTNLDLRSNKIKDWSFLLKMPNLKSLNANDNDLLHFPQEICSLKHLGLLSISYNRNMKICPKELGFLPLHYLAFSDMDLLRIPGSFKRLTKVKSFWVGGSSFTGESVQKFFETASDASRIELWRVLFVMWMRKQPECARYLNK